MAADDQFDLGMAGQHMAQALVPLRAHHVDEMDAGFHRWVMDGNQGGFT